MSSTNDLQEITFNQNMFHSLIDKEKCHYSLIDKGTVTPSFIFDII